MGDEITTGELNRRLDRLEDCFQELDKRVRGGWQTVLTGLVLPIVVALIVAAVLASRAPS